MILHMPIDGASSGPSYSHYDDRGRSRPDRPGRGRSNDAGYHQQEVLHSSDKVVELDPADDDFRSPSIVSVDYLDDGYGGRRKRSVDPESGTCGKKFINFFAEFHEYSSTYQGVKDSLLLIVLIL